MDTPIRSSALFALKKVVPFWLIAIPRFALNGLIIGTVTFVFSLLSVYGYYFVNFNPKQRVTFSMILQTPSIVKILYLITAALVALWAWAAIKKITLDLYDQQKTPFFLSSQLGHGILIACTSIIDHCVACIGYCMLIFPGAYLQLRWIFHPFAIVDQNRGPVAALSQSWRTSERIKRVMFWLAIIFAIATFSVFIFYWYHGTFSFVHKIIAHQRHFFSHSYKYTAKLSKILNLFYEKHRINLLGNAGIVLLVIVSLWQLFLASLYRQLNEKR
ncbi:MAG: hypothetical protein UV38_C0001G0084 [candidate division TM6 bacterium GW2011_GWE2_42_60]|nr:MAG: hypothetical protein UV38_C0001G0084 [candidate division TM6 bacterium GW2011_GWE2_42_60]HBY05720.1 hypothetical protein [Candidatus Dependentiae bacterium]